MRRDQAGVRGRLEDVFQAMRIAGLGIIDVGLRVIAVIGRINDRAGGVLDRHRLEIRQAAVRIKWIAEFVHLSLVFVVGLPDSGPRSTVLTAASYAVLVYRPSSGFLGFSASGEEL